MLTHRRRLTLTALVVATLLLVPTGTMGAVPDATASHESGTSPAFVAEMEANGTVEVTVRYTFDLSDDARADAFRELQDNESAQEAFLTTFRNRMELVTTGTAEATGRDVTAGEADIAFRTADSTGVVELSVPIENLAAVGGDRVVLSEPFASNFDPEREFRVVLPDGYEVVSATPEPTSAGGSELTYAAGADPEGFEVVADQSDSGSGDSTDNPDSTGGADGTDRSESTAGAGSPGFGVAATLVALAAVLIGLRVR